MNPLALMSLKSLMQPVILAVLFGLFFAPMTIAATSNNNASTRDAMKQKNSAENVAGAIEGDVEMEGVAIINDRVFIDGESISKGTTVHVGKKSGLKYRINWGKGGNVSVAQEQK